MAESIRGVRDGIAALPQEQQAGLCELWQKNVEALGIDEGTAVTLKAVQKRTKEGDQAFDNVDPIRRIIYNISYENAGYKSGYKNAGAQLDFVTIVVMRNTSRIVTAFPSNGEYGKVEGN